MKKVLILVVSSEVRPYGKMIDTSLETWDSIKVEGVQTIFYCGTSTHIDTDKIKHFPITESLHNMGHKGLLAYEWALNNLEFDYVARVNSSCYVSKNKLLDYVQTLPNDNLFEGLMVSRPESFDYAWGGGQFILSRDVLQLVVDNKDKWNHSYMEDESLGLLLGQLGIKTKQGNSCSINKEENNWMLLSYGFGESIKFTDFKDVANTPHYFFRVKQDGQREKDEYLMIKLHENKI
jgi:hypothetical protein